MKFRILSAVACALCATSVCAQSLDSLAEKHGFKMGAVISASTVKSESYRNLLSADFNSLTASNEFKAYSLLNRYDSSKAADGMPVMNYRMADEIASFAQKNGFVIRGHVLVWDAYMPDWFFKEGYASSGKFVDSETMKKRLKSYITDVITHFETKFPGVVYCWDVVNEAVGDSSTEYKAGDARRVRTVRSGTKNLFYETIGDDYVELSFKYAREAANKVNPKIKLFYNDYNTFQSPKRAAITALVKSINKDEKLCDGIGMQGYIGGYGQQAGCMNQSDIKAVRDSIVHYANQGWDVHITELALRNYDQKAGERHAAFYENFFKMLASVNKEKTVLTNVSIWGLTDDPKASPNSYGYKMNGPYCGVYTETYAKKDEYNRIVNALK